jgi:ABC-2 type transport system ATP-binding protein
VTAPLLEAADPRFSGAGLALGSFDAHGSLLVLVGAWAPLFDLIAGSRPLAGGRLALAGRPAEGAAARGDVGLARRDAPLPPSWSAHDVLTASAELLGDSRRQASARAHQLMGELGLDGLAGKRPATLRPAEWRALGIAAAVLGAPAVLAIEEPFVGLEPSGQAYVDAVIGRALRGRAGLVSVGELPGSTSDDALAARSDELLFLSGRRLVARGSYRELSSRAKSYRLVVQRGVDPSPADQRPVDALLARLGEAGYEVRRMSTADATTLWLTDRAGLGTVPVFRAALAVDATILELVPLELAALAEGESLAAETLAAESLAERPHAGRR